MLIAWRCNDAGCIRSVLSHGNRHAILIDRRVCARDIAIAVNGDNKTLQDATYGRADIIQCHWAALQL
ncbi:MAG: hypothetical protein EON47_08140 [Acetobacteraceae bacterium]|nr:MAG: hypothetical protein EON47_08140 [Acetobacteraceae bacterium]